MPLSPYLRPGWAPAAGLLWFRLALGLALTLALAGCRSPAGSHSTPPRYVLVLHGGAGVLDRKAMSSEKTAALRQAMTEALRVGEMVLRTNGTSLDAVSATIKVLEDSPLFNAGRGAVLNRDGIAEMDASIMEGATRRAGAVAGIHNARNPIEAARAAMERTPHVLLAGPGADAFAVQQGLRLEAPDYFITEPRRQQWERLRRENASRTDIDPARAGEQAGTPDSQPAGQGIQAGTDHSDDAHFAFRDRVGTVGAVALDRHGNLAAGTSTGGLADKLPGRVGDSPIIGAGTYADNATCAVSATGHGEFFIRAAVAHDIAALLAYRGLSLEKAANLVVRRKLVDFGGAGGVIAVDRQGHIATPFNSEGMYRGHVREGSEPHIGIYEP